MEILAAVFGATLPSVAIEDSVVGDLDLVVEVQELLNILVVIFHVVPLANVRDDTCVVALNKEF